jgi:uncharacterized protein (UPF0335 family)
MGRQGGLPTGVTRVTLRPAGGAEIDITDAFARAGRGVRRRPSPQGEAFNHHETGEARSRGETMSDPIQGDQLKTIVQRIERLEEEKKTLLDDIKDIYAEAKANGYDVKVLRKVIALRKRDLSERREEEAVLDLYLQAVGETP